MVDSANFSISNITHMPLFNSNLPKAPTINLLKSISPSKRNFIFNRAKGKRLFNNVNTIEEYKLIFFSSQRTIFIIDCIISILNVAIVFLMFKDYDKFTHNNFKLNKTNNVIRYICLSFTIIIICLLILRYVLKVKFQFIKYVLGIRLSCKVFYLILYRSERKN